MPHAITDISEIADALSTSLRSTSVFANEITITDAAADVAHGLHAIATAIDRLADRLEPNEPLKRAWGASS